MAEKGLKGWIATNKELLVAVLAFGGYQGYDAAQPDAKEDTMQKFKVEMSLMQDQVFAHSESWKKYYDEKDSPEYRKRLEEDAVTHHQTMHNKEELERLRHELDHVAARVR